MQVIRHKRSGDGVQKRGLIFVGLLLVVALGVWPWSRTQPMVDVVRMYLSAVALLSGIAILVLLAIRSKYKNIGEDMALQELRKLGNEYLTIVNFSVPGHKRRAIDVVVAGPHGVVAVEVKPRAHKMRCRGDLWSTMKTNGDAIPLKRSPSKHVRTLSVSLMGHLRKNGFHGAVNPALVFQNSAELDLVNPTVTVMRVKELMRWLQALPKEDLGAVDVLLTLEGKAPRQPAPVQAADPLAKERLPKDPLAREGS